MVELIWVDIETTCLDPDKGCILEIAAIHTDDSFKELNCFTVKVQRDPDAFINDYCLIQHAKSGLWDTFGAVPLYEAEYRFRHRLKAWGKLPMAGSEVGNFERVWFAKHMPNILPLFDRRSFNINSILMWEGKDINQLKRNRRHRAIADLRQDLEFVRGLRDKA